MTFTSLCVGEQKSVCFRKGSVSLTLFGFNPPAGIAVRMAIHAKHRSTGERHMLRRDATLPLPRARSKTRSAESTTAPLTLHFSLFLALRSFGNRKQELW